MSRQSRKSLAFQKLAATLAAVGVVATGQSAPDCIVLFSAATVCGLAFLAPQAALAASCPYCGKDYGSGSSSDWAYISRLRSEHEASCPARNKSGGQSGSSSGGSSGGGGGVSRPLPLPDPYQLQKLKIRSAANNQNDRGIEFAKDGRWTEAIGAFKAALDQYPEYDSGRDKIRENLEFAQQQLERLTQQNNQTAPATDSSDSSFSDAQTYLNKLRKDLNVENTGNVPEFTGVHVRVPGERDIAESSGDTASLKQALENNPPAALPMPQEMLDAEKEVNAALHSKYILAENKQFIVEQYAMFLQRFNKHWEPLAKAYREKLGAQEDFARLRQKILDHNNNPAVDLQQYNDERRMLLSQMYKIEEYKKDKERAYSVARADHEYHVWATLRAGDFKFFRQFVREIEAIDKQKQKRK